MALSSQWLDELKTRISLSALIMRTTKLTRAGNEWKACCPFHSEKTPSFYVNDQKGFYHCFGCQKHGGAIDWMMEQHGLPFMDAVKELAASAGMDVPAPDPQAAQRAEQRASLHDVMQAAQDWFVACLQSAQGAAARDYLRGRGIDDHTLAQFGFGFAPDDRQALAGALGQFDPAMLVEAGLLIQVDDKPPYARFRGRVMLPIHDPRGRVIAFGGRILEAAGNAARGGIAKYLNSPDTPLFDKGRTLYNLHRAGPASRKAGRLIVVEGYLDVVALAQAGIAEAVAPMGTALTEQQLDLLWRITEKPLLCLDGDGAGLRAAMRAAGRALPLLRPGHSLQIATLPAGMDPDDLVRRSGAAGVDQVLAQSQSLLDLVWNHERGARPLSSPEDKAGLKARLLAHVDTIADPDIRALYRRELLERFSAFAFPKRDPNGPGGRSGSGQRPFGQRPVGQRHRGQWSGSQLFAGSTTPEATARLRRAAAGAARDTLALAVLHGLARHPAQIAPHEESLLRLASTDPRIAPLIEGVLDCAERLEAPEDFPISILGDLPPPPENSCFSFLVEGSDPEEAREDLAEAVAFLVERPELEAAILAAAASFDRDPESAFAEQQRLRKRKLEIEVRVGQMARKRAAAAALKTDDAGVALVAPRTQETD